MSSPSSEFLATMLGSATSGMLSRIPCHPIDTIKARLQVHAYSGVLHAVRSVWQSEGWRGFYRGFPAAFIGSAPASCLYFTTYESVREAVPRAFPAAAFFPAAVHLFSGLAAEAASCILWVPIDVVKERMQVQNATGAVYYSNTRDAIRQIMRREGLIGLYRGYGATIASFGPFSALYFAFYERLKAEVLERKGFTTSQSLPLPWQIATASTAGAAASFLTNPLDIVKLRLQVQRGMAAAAAGAAATAVHVGNDSAAAASLAPPFQYRNLLHGLRSIVHTEGWRALFRGAGARMAFHAPSTAITMTLFENCRDAYRSLLLARQ